MKKKTVLISLILIFSILISIVPQTVFAQKTENVIYINEQVYDSSSPSTNILSAYANISDLKEYIFKKCDQLTKKVDISHFNIPYNESTHLALKNLIFADMPELFHIDSQITIYTEGIITHIGFEYLCSKANYATKKLQLETAVNEYIGDLKINTLSDLEKALILHDRIALGCEYTLNDGFCRTVYGAIVEGYAVCQGYAEAYSYLLDKLGIDNYICTSDTLNHEWNIVYINGKKYHVDITWDDPVDDIYGRVNHDNFLRSTNGIKQTHNASDFDSTPTDTTYDLAIWQNSKTAFVLLKDNIYYLEQNKIQNNTAYIKNYRTNETLYTFSETWLIDSSHTWTGIYSRLACDGKYLYFNLKDCVYRFDPTTNKAVKIKQIVTDSENYFWVFGFVYKDGYFYCHINNSPNFQDSQDEYFTSFYYSSSPDDTSSVFNSENSVLNVNGNGIITEQSIDFSDKSSIRHIIFSDKITQIGENCFRNSTNLKTIVFPSSITKISNNAFENCQNLDTIFFTGSKAMWDTIEKPEFTSEVIFVEDSTPYLYFIQKPIQVSYFQNDTINTDGAIIAVFSQGEIYIGDIPKNALSISKLINSGTQKITVTYKKASDSFDIQVIALKVTEIKILKSDDTDYCVGQSFDKSRYKAEISYNNSAIETKALSELKNLTLSGYSSKAGSYTVTVTYENVNAIIKVNVLDHLYNSECAEKCLRCNLIRSINHDFKIEHNKTQHYNLCNECDLKTDFENHTFKQQVCSICGCKKEAETPEYEPEKSEISQPDAIKKEFVDVPENAWYKEYVDFAVAKGIFNGTGEKTFSPSNVMTRAQFVQVFANISGINTDNTNVQTKFSDVKSGMWYTPAVKWASENGIVSGTGDGKFAPESSVTREMMCVILVNYVENYQKKSLKEETAKQNFTDDTKISSWAKIEVYKCQRANLISGIGNGSFAPKDTATRAVGATIFSDFYKKYMI